MLDFSTHSRHLWSAQLKAVLPTDSSTGAVELLQSHCGPLGCFFDYCSPGQARRPAAGPFSLHVWMKDWSEFCDVVVEFNPVLNFIVPPDLHPGLHAGCSLTNICDLHKRAVKVAQGLLLPTKQVTSKQSWFPYVSFRGTRFTSAFQIFFLM